MGEKHRMIHLGRGIIEACMNVRKLEIRKILEDFCNRDTSSKEIKHIFNPDAHAADARPTTTLMRIEGNAIHYGKMIDEWR